MGGEPAERLADVERRVRVGGGARVQRLVEGGGAPDAAAAQLVQREVRRRPVQPGAQVRPGQVARRAPPGPRERLLAEVLGRVEVAEHPPQPARERGGLLGDELLELHDPILAAALIHGG